MALRKTTRSRNDDEEEQTEAGMDTPGTILRAVSVLLGFDNDTDTDTDAGSDGNGEMRR
jgi:hypothetical protein